MRVCECESVECECESVECECESCEFEKFIFVKFIFWILKNFILKNIFCVWQDFVSQVLCFVSFVFLWVLCFCESGKISCPNFVSQIESVDFVFCESVKKVCFLRVAIFRVPFGVFIKVLFESFLRGFGSVGVWVVCLCECVSCVECGFVWVVSLCEFVSFVFLWVWQDFVSQVLMCEFVWVWEL